MERIKEITQEEWQQCNKYNRDILDEFLMNSPQLSPKTKNAYQSNLMIWFNWIRQYLNNKAQHEVKSIEYMKFQNWLISLGHSSSDISNKRAAISSLNNYIVLFYSDDYPTFKNFIVRGMPKPEKKMVHEKNPPTKEEMNHLIQVLEERGDWQKVAYLKYVLCTGCRRAATVQLLKEVVNYKMVTKDKIVTDEEGNKKIVEIKYYTTHKIREKGRGETGKIRTFRFDEDVLNAFKKWLEVRGEDDCPYMFVSKRGDIAKQLNETTLNKWATNTFTPIVGRRINPHIFRAAKATISVVEDGKSIEAVQALLGHESSDTTKIYICKDDTDEDVDELFF